MTFAILLIIAGFVALVVGADQAVGGARNIALRFGISELIIGLTVTSIGTSLPELATAAAAALASDGADAAAGVEHRRVVQRRAFVYVPRVRRRAAVE